MRFTIYDLRLSIVDFRFADHYSRFASFAFIRVSASRVPKKLHQGAVFKILASFALGCHPNYQMECLCKSRSTDRPAIDNRRVNTLAAYPARHGAKGKRHAKMFI
jgi:hypothetical protein